MALRTIFAVLGVTRRDLMEPAIAQAYPDNHLVLQPGEWLVADEGTAINVAEKLGVGVTPTGSSALIVSISGYYGRQSPSVWEWIKAKWGGDPLVQ